MLTLECKGNIYRKRPSFLHALMVDNPDYFSDVVSQVLGDMPPDPTNLEDMIHAALFSGRPAEGLRNASQLDRWLAAHLASIMAPLQLIDAEEDEECVRLVRTTRWRF